MGFQPRNTRSTLIHRQHNAGVNNCQSFRVTYGNGIHKDD